jgi:hypothetical protein
MTFDSDMEHSIAMQDFADEIYKSVLPISSITRFTRNDKQVHILDKYFHIDCVLHLENGQIMTLQEKFLRGRYASFDCYTLEYFNNQSTNETGEWHRLCTDLYFTGYGEVDTGFVNAYLFKTLEVKLALLRDELKGTLKKTITSNANFYAYPFNQFKDEWFIYKSRG